MAAELFVTILLALGPVLRSADARRPAPGDGPAGMVIVTDHSLVAPFTTLAEAHERRGLVTRVRTLQSIRDAYPAARDDAERIRMFLADARTSWGIEFALMGGDEPLIPMRGVTLDRLPLHGRGAGLSLPTDQYYACLAGDWSADGDALSPDLCVGRAPVTDAKQADAFVAKTIRALERPAREGPLSALVVAAGSLDPAPRAIPRFAPFAEGIAARLERLTTTTITRLYRNEGEGTGARPLTRASVLAALGKPHDLTFLLGFGGPGSFSLDTTGRPETLDAEDLLALESSGSTGQLISLAAFTTVPGRPSLGAALIRGRGGCVSVLGPTDIEVPSLAAAYVEAYLRGGLANPAATIGEAMRSALRGMRIPPARDNVRLTTLGNVLLGDPALPFPRAGVANAAPVSGAPPSPRAAAPRGSAP